MLRALAPMAFRGVALQQSRYGGMRVAAHSSMHQPLGVPPEGTDVAAVRSKWGSNAMDLVLEEAPIKVRGPVAMCDGGGGPLGHPMVYIQLNRADAEFPAVCKYCGRKYISDL